MTSCDRSSFKQLTTEEVILQALPQAEMRRPQSIVEFVEVTAVVLALQVTLDILEQGLDALETVIEGIELVL